MKPIATCLVLCALVLGCTVEPDARLALIVETDDPAHVVEVQRVLLERFESQRPSLLASVDSSITGSTLDFAFTWWIPDWDALEPLYSTPGRLSASLAGQVRPVFTHEDVRRAFVTSNNGGPALNIRLTSEAGDRLAETTSRNIGAFMTMTLDGDTVSEARVNSVLGASFVLEGMELDELRMLSTIIESGAFPEGATTRAASVEMR
jgi:hypothetical protein